MDEYFLIEFKRTGLFNFDLFNSFGTGRRVQLLLQDLQH